MNPQTGQTAWPSSGWSSRKLAQPFVRQYSLVVSDRRRMRRIDADRPTTDEWVVRESMWFLRFLLAAKPGDMSRPAVVVLIAGWAMERYSCLVDAGAGRSGSLTRSML